jgi:hypothetical protein
MITSQEAIMVRTMSIMAVAAALLSATAAVAQHAPSATPVPTTARSYQIRSFGAFRQLMMHGDFGAKAAFPEVMATRPSIGVGAVSDARGEITIADGKLIVSYGKEGPRPAPETAALLAIGTVADWQTIRVASDVPPAEIEAYLAAVAQAQGIDPDRSFPFQVRGSVGPFVMHVNAAPTGGPYGMGKPMAITVETKGDAIAGSVAGLYVSSDLMGVVTHGGERTHSHWVSGDGTATAHLDRWGIKAGATLMLPKPE